MRDIGKEIHLQGRQSFFNGYLIAQSEHGQGVPPDYLQQDGNTYNIYKVGPPCFPGWRKNGNGDTFIRRVWIQIGTEAFYFKSILPGRQVGIGGSSLLPVA